MWFVMVPAAGVEPATFRSGGERSNPLSYAGLNKIAGSKRCITNVPLFVPLFVTLVNNSALVSGGFLGFVSACPEVHGK